MSASSEKYDEWSENYDQYVEEAEKKGHFPFAGHSVVLETIKKTIKTYSKGGSILDLGSGTGMLDRDLAASGYEVTGVDFSPKMVEIAKANAPAATFYEFDLSKGVLPEEIKDKKFKFIVSSYLFHSLPKEGRIAFIKSLRKENLEDDGLILLGDVAFKNETELEACKSSAGSTWRTDADYPVYDEFRKEIPGLVFQKISFCAGIMALAKNEPEVTEKAKEGNEAEEESQSESSPKEEEKGAPDGQEKATDEQMNEESDPSLKEYSPEEIEKWERVRDIPGETIISFGTNFYQAISPYEKEVVANWSLLAENLQNLFGGTFTNNDLLVFRTQALTTYVKVNQVLPRNEKETDWVCRLFAAGFLHNRFPGDKIDTNLYGLYLGLMNDLKVVFNELAKEYGNDIAAVRKDLANPSGTKVANALTIGLVERKRR